MDFNERFSQYLSFKGLTLREFSRLSCVSVSTVSRFCNGRDIGSSILLKVLQACDDLSLEWFFFGTGDMIRRRDSLPVDTESLSGTGVENRGGSTGTGDDQSSFLEYQRLLSAKDELISQRDEVISKLLERLSAG